MSRNVGRWRLGCKVAGLCRRHPTVAISRGCERKHDLTTLGATGRGLLERAREWRVEDTGGRGLPPYSGLSRESDYVGWIGETLRD